MSSRSILSILLILFLITSVSATYAGDRPLEMAYFTDEPVEFIFTTGNSTYSGSLGSGDEYTVAFPISLPPDAGIRYARVYLYWSWSRIGQEAIYPEFSVTLSEPATHMKRYTDSKGFVAANDYFSGMDIFEPPAIGYNDQEIILHVMNNAEDDRTVVIIGGGLLIVYTSTSSEPGMLWVMEGCDMLYATHGITPAMATSPIAFDGSVRTRDVTSATLSLVAPSAGYTRTEIPEKNAVFVNRERGSNLPGFIESIISALFPGYNGKVWYDVFQADEINQIGIATRDVRQYLRSEGNRVLVQDNGDYFVLNNAFLDIRYGSG